MPGAGEHASADLLEFAAPGLLHGLGNNLFSIHGHAQMLRGGDTDVAREKAAIVKASEKALNALAILRYLVGEGGPEPAPQAGVLLLRLFETLRVPLHEAGLQVQFSHGSGDAPVSVEGQVLCQSVVTVLRALAIDVPPGLQRAVVVDLAAQGAGGAEVVFRVAMRPSFLPFPVDLDKLLANAAMLLARHGARLDAAEDGQRLTLWLPVSEAPPRCELRTGAPAERQR